MRAWVLKPGPTPPSPPPPPGGTAAPSAVRRTSLQGSGSPEEWTQSVEVWCPTSAAVAGLGGAGWRHSDWDPRLFLSLAERALLWPSG